MSAPRNINEHLVQLIDFNKKYKTIKHSNEKSITYPKIVLVRANTLKNNAAIDIYLNCSGIKL